MGDPLPFAQGQASGIEELTGANPMAINVLTDPGGALFTRPGIVTWDEWACPAIAAPESTAGTIIGAAVWPSVSGEILVYVTEDRRLWAMLGPNNRIALSDATAATQLDGTGRPTFAVAKTRIVIAGGGAPQKWEGVGLSSRLGGSPPNMSHVVANSQRLAGSAPTVGGFLFWSDPGETTGHETWDTGLNFAEAEARPDVIKATYENSNEIFAFGESTLQLFVPDPDAGYVAGRASNFGCPAPYSPIQVSEGFVLLATEGAGRTFGLTDGRDLTSISDPAMGKTIDRFETVDDCWGFRLHVDSWDLAVWVFPTEGRTIAFDSSSKQWSEWKSRVDGATVPWIGTCFANWKSRNLNLVGLPDGTMGLFDPDTFSDDGEALQGTVRTGHIDRGNKNQKTCQRLALQIRKSSTDGLITVRWREGLGRFEQPINFDLSANGDTDVPVAKWTLGMYRARQWQLDFTGPSRLVVASSDETHIDAES